MLQDCTWCAHYMLAVHVQQQQSWRPHILLLGHCALSHIGGRRHGPANGCGLWRHVHCGRWRERGSESVKNVCATGWMLSNDCEVTSLLPLVQHAYAGPFGLVQDDCASKMIT